MLFCRRYSMPNMESSAVAATMYMKPRWMCSAPKIREETMIAAVSLLIALTAQNEEAQSFYRKVEHASMHDTGIWIDI